MNKQQGAALVVVLSMLTMSLMLGLSGMQSSLVEERLSGNYKAATEAQMAAEKAASSGWGIKPGSGDFKGSSYSIDAMKEVGWEEFVDNENFEGEELSDDVCSGDVKCHYRFVDVGGNYYIVAIGAVGDGSVAVSESVLVEVMFEGGAIFGFEPEATVTCLGAGCDFTAGSGKSGPAIDGTDRKAEGKTQGANRPDPVYDENGNEIFVPAVIMADRGASPFDSGSGGKGKGGKSGKGGKGGGIVGEELYTDHDYNSFKENKDADGDFKEDEEGWVAVKASLQSKIDAVIEEASSSDEIFYAGPGETVSPGTAEGVVVVNGGTLSLKGSEKFTGLVIVRNGEIDSTGTPAIVGAVIGEDYSFVGTGNPTVLYSSEAIGNVNNGGGSGGGAGSTPEIKEWQ